MAAKDEVINKFNPKSGPDRDEDKIVPEYPFNDVEVSVFGTKQTYHHPKQLKDRKSTRLNSSHRT